MYIFSGCRNVLCSRSAFLLPLLLVLIFSGQRQVFGDNVASGGADFQQTVVDASGEMETIHASFSSNQKEGGREAVDTPAKGRPDSPEITPEGRSASIEHHKQQQQQQQQQQSCIPVDTTALEEESKALKAKLLAAEERLKGLHEKAVAQKVEQDSELQSCGSTSAVLAEEVKVLNGEVKTLESIIERAGGADGIDGLVESVAVVEEAKRELLEEMENLEGIIERAGGVDGIDGLVESVTLAEGTEKEMLSEIETLEGIIKRAGGATGIDGLVESVALAEKAKRELLDEAESREKEAEREMRAAVERAAEMKSSLQSKLDAAQEELEELRSKLTGAEARESEARQEAGRHASDKEEVGRLLERTASELKMARTPRQVSVSAIVKDVNQLYSDVMQQSKDARDDIVAKGKETIEKGMNAARPHLENAVETVKPWIEKAVVATEPHRAQAGEVYVTYKKNFDETAGKQAAEKWSDVEREVSKYVSQGVSEWEKLEAAVMRKLIDSGVPEAKAQKACRFMYMVTIASATVLLLLYLGKPVVTCIVLPLVRVSLGLALWIVKLPFRILFSPIRLLLWVLVKCFRLVFGGGGGGSGDGVKKTPPPN